MTGVVVGFTVLDEDEELLEEDVVEALLLVELPVVVVPVDVGLLVPVLELEELDELTLLVVFAMPWVWL